MSKEQKELWSHRNDKDANLAVYIGSDGKITIIDRKNAASLPKNRIVSPSTTILTEKGAMTMAEAFAKGLTIKYDPSVLKHGGSIFLNNVLLKYQQGGSIPKYASGNVVSTIYNNGQGTNWYDTIGSQYQEDLFTALENETDPKKR